MDAGTVVLLPSPLVGVRSRGALPDALRHDGMDAVAVAAGTGLGRRAGRTRPAGT